MSEIKPVYQLRVRFNLWEDQTKKQYEDSKFGDGVPRILYPAAAYEALQKELEETRNHQRPFYWRDQNDKLKAENAELKRNHKFTCENLANTVPFIEELEQKNAAQANRISELENWANSLFDTRTKNDREIESLRKQVEELLSASRLAITALAHTSQKNTLYDEAYERLDSAISFVSASKNGE